MDAVPTMPSAQFKSVGEQSNFGASTNITNTDDPTPVCAFEVVSPSSRQKDKNNPTFTIEKLGIPLCVVIDRVNHKGELRRQTELSVWQRDPKTGKAVKVKPNLKKEYRLAPLNMSIGVQGSSVYFVDGESGEVLRDIEMEREDR
ncbi:MAG: hypothetical protein AAF639_14715 [Chloroflexota bacterium]